MNIKDFIRDNNLEDSIFSREIGELDIIINKKLTIDEVFHGVAKSTGNEYYLFTVREEVKFKFFAPPNLAAKFKLLEANHFNLIEFSGLNLYIRKENFIKDDKEYYSYKCALE